MKKAELKPGDWVWFIDSDQIRWGPWRVLEVRQSQVRVSIEGVLTDVVPCSQVQKVTRLQPA